jgi:hypothetical protein
LCDFDIYQYQLVGMNLTRALRDVKSGNAQAATDGGRQPQRPDSADRIRAQPRAQPSLPRMLVALACTRDRRLTRRRKARDDLISRAHGSNSFSAQP